MSTKAIVTIDDTFENIENEMRNLGFSLYERPNNVYHIKPSNPDKNYPTNQRKKGTYDNYTFSELIKQTPLIASSYLLNVAVLRKLPNNQYKLVISNNGKPGFREYHEKIAENFFTGSDQQNK